MIDTLKKKCYDLNPPEDVADKLKPKSEQKVPTLEFDFDKAIFNFFNVEINNARKRKIVIHPEGIHDNIIGFLYDNSQKILSERDYTYGEDTPFKTLMVEDIEDMMPRLD